jgi:hypothetical protein
VVERRHQPDVTREQHPVAEDVTAHVADADHDEVLLLDVVVELAEVPPHALPRAARGDAHRLVVVPGGAAGGERVTEPEAVLRGDPVRDVGERGGALVRGDHEVGVVAVVPDDAGRRHGHALAVARDEVVGEVEQAPDERLVRRHALGQPRVAVAGVG